jgi:transposase InsO family protein
MKRISVYLKMKVLGAIEFAEGASIAARIRAVAAQRFTDEEGAVFQFTWRTISTWLYVYKVHGLPGLETRPRSDKGKTRKVLPEALLEAIEKVLPQFRAQAKSYNKALIYRACIEQGLLRREDVAPNTFSRLVNQLELLKPDAEVLNKRRLAFAKAHANQCWQADTLHGPHLAAPSGHKAPAKLIAFIDDASRVLCHGQFFLSDSIPNLLSAFQTALYKRGIPEMLYVDNGSTYASAEMAAVCARIGCLLCHTPVRDGAAKGKIERFFGTVRRSFLVRQLDLSSLDALNRQFTEWVENHYNGAVHATLGMRPIDRFGLDRSRLRFLPPNQANDELFYIEQPRKVRADNTFSLAATRYEAPADLRNRAITVRYDRRAPGRPAAIVYYQGQRIGPRRRASNLSASGSVTPLPAFPSRRCATKFWHCIMRRFTSASMVSAGSRWSRAASAINALRRLPE